MTTRTDEAIRMAIEAIEDQRDSIENDQTMQDFTIRIKFKRGWPFKRIWQSTSVTEKGQ